MTLEKLFTSKTRIEVLQHLLFSGKSTHLRKLSNDLKKPVSAVKREVDNLASIGIVKKSENEISINEECNIVLDLRNLFVKTDSFVNPIAKSLEKANLDFAFVFGSFAKGNYTVQSDVDLFIVGDLKQAELLKMLKSAEKEIQREINPVIWSLNELKKNSGKSFVRDIAKGKIIMIKGNENELRKIIGNQ
jgi:predicted nucleotidyltransferase